MKNGTRTKINEFWDWLWSRSGPKDLLTRCFHVLVSWSYMMMSSVVLLCHGEWDQRLYVGRSKSWLETMVKFMKFSSLSLRFVGFTVGERYDSAFLLLQKAEGSSLFHHDNECCSLRLTRPDFHRESDSVLSCSESRESDFPRSPICCKHISWYSVLTQNKKLRRVPENRILKETPANLFWSDTSEVSRLLRDSLHPQKSICRINPNTTAKQLVIIRGVMLVASSEKNLALK